MARVPRLDPDHPPLEPDEPRDYCSRFADGEQYVGTLFHKAGYRSLYAEDWVLGVFNWPGCIGFQKNPVDHYLK